MKKIILLSGVITTATIPLTLVACGVNDANNEEAYKGLSFVKNGFSKDLVLYKTTYNDLYDKVDDNHVGLAIIANHKFYTEVIPKSDGDKVLDIMHRSTKFDFNTFNPGIGMGEWVKTYREKNTQDWLHGTRETKNYNDYYPLYYINHNFAQLGVSNYTLSGHEMIEISYDDK